MIIIINNRTNQTKFYCIFHFRLYRIFHPTFRNAREPNRPLTQLQGTKPNTAEDDLGVSHGPKTSAQYPAAPAAPTLPAPIPKNACRSLRKEA